MIITFYSYKGGVGRTMALANIAELFFRNGKKVLMVDWDLEAPGLDRYFFKDDSLEDLLEKPGLVDMILDYKEKMMQAPTPADKNTGKTLPFKEIDHFLVDIYPDEKNGGKLWLLPPGRRSTKYFAKYANTVITFDWKDFYENWAGELYFEWLRRQFENKADVILIDSRTGLTEIGGVCTYQLADIIILLCGTNQQNIDGTYRMVKNFTSEEIKKLRTDRPLDILVVPARTEVAEGGKLSDFKVQFIEKFTQFMPPTVSSDIWELRIPYIPFYAYSEAAAVREGSMAVAEEMAESYKKIYEVLTTEYKKSSGEAIDVISKTDVNKENEIIKQDEGENEFEPLDVADSTGISADITILHLSELHFRRKRRERNEAFRRDIQDNMVDAVKAHLEKHKPPDFVVVTGDIAFSGKKHEYDEAFDFFTKLKSILPADTQFLVVPGNHDVDRGKVSQIFSLHRIVIENQIDKLLENKENMKHFINAKFNGFLKFCHRLNPSLYKSKDDYFWVKKFPDKKVAFLGLNSAWASEGDNDRFNIALGYKQVMEALEKSKDISNRILLVHHPLFNWLEERDSQKWSGEVFKMCRLILHGHVHVDSAMSISTPSDSCISIGANATYTHDGYIGFQFIRVHFTGERVKVRVWPYKLDTLERITFLPSTSRWHGQKGIPYFDLEAPRSSDGEEDLRPLQIPTGYREWLVQFHSKMDIEQLDPNAQAYHVPLPEVYIPIETSNPFYKPKDKKSMKEGGKKDIIESLEKSDESKEPQYIDIEELLGRKACILLRGSAGTGKTTLVKHLAYTITHSQGPISLCDTLPVVVFLKDLWSIYQDQLNSKGSSGITFQSLLKIYLETKIPELKLVLVEDFMSRHRALFLLDGLDEVPERIRRGLVEIIAGFRLENKTNRFLLTGRPHGIDSGVTQHFGTFLHDIETLDDKKIKEFVSNWFRVVSGQAVGLADMTAAEMIGDIQVKPHVSVFTENPLLLTAVCILYQDKKRLPDQRAELYCRILDNLINRRFHNLMNPEKASRIDDFLKLLAFHMQECNIKSIDVGGAKQLLKKIFLQEDETPAQYKRRIDNLFKEIEPRCGILKRPGEGEVEFLHLTFQEFLAARHMLYMEMDYKKFLAKPWWEETILLFTGLINREWKERANLMVKEILTYSHKEVNELHRLWLLGSKALRDIQAYKRGTEVAGLAREKLINVIGSDESLGKRFEAGEILGILGDSRIRASPMVQVEVGDFTMGGDDFDNEKPIHHVYLDEFMIGKYPVTNEEFRAFILEGGYSDKDCWTPEGWQWKVKNEISEPGFWREAKWNRPNFPVVGVSWYEASAYAKWLSQKTGNKYILPSEAQWEKSARGTDGMEYPWGKKFDKNKCNSDECDLNRTSPVGIFPAGTSPYGCYDMAGNVWEWCWDWYEEDYYKKSPVKNPTGPSTGSHRVIKGGSWLFNAWHSRAACRNYVYPAFRDLHLGFRLVRSF